LSAVDEAKIENFGVLRRDYETLKIEKRDMRFDYINTILNY
jgi:hypothetical protein